MSKMKNRWGVRLICVCIIGLIIYVGYIPWNNYLDARERVVGVEWVVPLSEIYSHWDNDIRKLDKDLKVLNLQLMIEDNNDDASYEKLCGVKNSQGKIIIPPIYERLEIGSEQEYILAKNYDTKKYHYYKLDGTDFIKGDFQDVSMFENGYACVEKKGQRYVIDMAGNVQLKVKCEWLSSFDSEKKLFQYEVKSKIHSSDGLGYWDTYDGLIDINGNVVLEPKYNMIQKASENRILVFYTNNKENWAGIYLDNNFQQVSTKSYEEATAFNQGVAVVKDTKGWHIINENEEIISDVPACQYMYAFSEGIAVAQFDKELKYLDTKGKVLFTLPYKSPEGQFLPDEICYYSEGLIAFPGRNQKLGYMDSKGRIVVEPVFDRAWPIENGEAMVEMYHGKKGVIKLK
nr:WG repeat-containing protein [uncultured Aminipila sp.]